MLRTTAFEGSQHIMLPDQKEGLLSTSHEKSNPGDLASQRAHPAK